MDATEIASSKLKASYDGFISYSHAADGLLAPRLQAGLQRFAKPWWKRRAVRVFRDETSLSANPHLWSSITEALDTSEWCVLLLSPDAAQSPWVNQEIEYWKEHKDPSRILPVLTDGTFEWSGIDVDGSAVPQQLQGVFSEEPRWVDLRFAKDERHLDLNDPRFADAVADVASALRGVPKDELASEEVRQHRRTIRTAWAAGVALAVLAVAAVGFGVQAAQQRDIAKTNAAAEAEAREEADRQASIALANEQIAERNEATAIRQAQIADSRRLATASRLNRETDTDLAMLLALQAITVTSDVEAISQARVVLREAVEAQKLKWRFPVPLGTHSAVLSPDASVVYHSSFRANALQAIHVVSKSVEVWYSETSDSKRLREVQLSPDGKFLSLVVAAAEEPGHVLIFDTETGETLKRLPSEGCGAVSTVGGGFSSEGNYFTMTTGREGCGDPAHPEADWAVAYDVSTWEPVYVHAEPGALAESITIWGPGEDRAFLAYGKNECGCLDASDPVGFMIVEFPGGETIGEYPSHRWPAASRSGDRVVFDRLRLGSGFALPRVHDSELSELFSFDTNISWLRRGRPVSFSPDGTMISAISNDQDFIFDAAGGSIIMRFGPDRPTLDYSWSADSSKLLTTHENALLLWAIRPDAQFAAELATARDMVELAYELLTRGFTALECSTYQVDPCPTLADLRDG